MNRPRTSIAYRLLQNSATIVACRVATVAVWLLAVPVIVRHLGLEGYGVWETLLALAAFGELLQVPIAGTLLWRASQAYGAGDEESTRRLVGFGISAGLLLTAVVLPPVVLARGWLVRTLNVPAALQPDALWVLPVVAAASLAGSLREPFAAVVDGAQRMALSTLVRSAGQIGGVLLSLGLVAAGKGLPALAAGQVLAFAITTGGLWACAARFCPRLSVRPRRPSPSELRQLARYGGLLTVGSAFAALRDHTSTLAFAALASPVWVGYYRIASRLAALALEASRFVYGPIIAAAGALEAGGDRSTLHRLYSGAMLGVAGLTGALAVLVVGLQDRLVIAWIGRAVPEVGLLLVLLVAGNAVAVMLAGAGTAVCRGIGRVDIETRYVATSLVLNIVLILTLVWLMGPVGTVVAAAASWAAGAAVFLVVLHRETELPLSATLRALRSVAAAGAAAALTLALSRALPMPGGRAPAALSALVLSLPSLGLYGLLLLALGALPPLGECWARLTGLRLQAANRGG